MKDIQERIERIVKEAAECDMIAKLATDPEKRALFKRLADRYQEMLDDLKVAVSKRM